MSSSTSNWVLPVAVLTAVAVVMFLFICWWFPRHWQKGNNAIVQELQGPQRDAQIADARRIIEEAKARIERDRGGSGAGIGAGNGNGMGGGRGAHAEGFEMSPPPPAYGSSEGDGGRVAGVGAEAEAPVYAVGSNERREVARDVV